MPRGSAHRGIISYMRVIFVKIIRNRNRLQKSEIASEIQKSLVEIRNRGLKSEITVEILKSRFEIRNHG